jgi:hypothetical protein
VKAKEEEEVERKVKKEEEEIEREGKNKKKEKDDITKIEIDVVNKDIIMENVNSSSVSSGISRNKYFDCNIVHLSQKIVYRMLFV